MLDMKKTAIASAIFLVSGVANATAINSMILTGGTFTLDAGSANIINPAAFANMSVDGSYDGSAPASIGTEASYVATSIATFELDSFGPVALYTAETDGINGPFPGVTGDVTGGNLTLDLSSLTAWWNDNTFNVGSGGSITATTYDAVTGDFTANWSAVTGGGPKAGIVAEIFITGNVQVVPVPAAVWLFGSGLLALAGVSRRCKLHKTGI